MKTCLFYFVVLLSLISKLTDTSPFHPIQAGTFQITTNDLLGLNKITKKQIILSTPYQIFQTYPNINIVCSITSINIEEHIGFQITYSLSQNQHRQKTIQVIIMDKKGYKYQNFHIIFDFFIAQDLRSQFYNMTDWQQHLSHQSRNEEQMNSSNKIIHNQLYLFLNGFSSVNLTGDLMYGYVANDYDMYTIHYMTGKNSQQKQGWTEKENFIYFRWVLFPRYPFGFKQCGGVFEPKLNEDFYFQCDKKGIDGYFYGLSGYSDRQFSGKFISSGNDFSFHVDRIDPNAKYSLVAFPFKISQKFQFIDNRKHQTFLLLNLVNLLKTYPFLMLSIILIVIMGVGVYFIKRKKLVYFDLHQQKPASHNNYKKDNHDKNSDEQLKQKQMCDSVIISIESEIDTIK